MARESVVPAATAAGGRRPLVPASEAGSSVAAGGPDLAPGSGQAAALGLAAEGPDPLLDLCEPAVADTIASSRAASTTALYANRWKLFSAWCLTQGWRCPLPTVLLFLQSLFDMGLTPSTIKVYAAAITAQHARVDGRTVGSHPLMARFLKGALHLRPPRRSRVPTWDLPLVLQALCDAPFEPLLTVDVSWLSMKTAFLLAITSAERVGELHALSVSGDCLRWHPGDSGVTLWPNPSFLPKTLSSAFVNQPLSLAAFEAGQGEGSDLLCPVRALWMYVCRMEGLSLTDALFLCHTGPRRGLALSKQRLPKWVVEAILHAYRHSGSTVPRCVRAHSTRSVAASWASLRGVPLSDICSAASWASTCTFTRFYRINVVPHNPVPTAVVPGPSQQH
ncbi:hypothetical protein ACEWY4_016825 [Coilia grayii]|uniref:Tyr recombinase domain-containing protein n=1 Tax=Coilia grayii TaxID=363190 RepID=A0ABD1JLJ6_9TELE